MSLPRYSEYKDSGVEWLGEVPRHWDVAPLKRSFKIVGGSTPKSEQEAYWDGEFVWVTPSDLSKLSSMNIYDSQRKITAEGLASCGTALVPSGSIVLSTRAPIGSLAIARTELCTNQGCKSLVPFTETQSKFYGYLLSISTTELNIRGKGTTFLELSGDELGAFKVSIPPRQEQQAIATFLDRETDKIDALIAEQQRLVELLAEKRQAVISHAVTKGLNTNAPMKDSGIEWLGDVPEHWEVLPIKRRCILLKDGTHLPPSRVSEGIPLLSVRNIQNGRFNRRDDDSLISQENYQDLCKAFIPQYNDVLLAIVGATLGKTALVPMDIGLFHIQRSVAIFRTTTEMQPQYLHFLFQSGEFQQLLWEYVGYSAQPGIYLGTLAEFRITLPPLVEQSAIVNFIDSETAKIDTLTSEANRAITLLQERRSALISASVTGKIDVRGRL
jgi:type I restriction enzyme S subunit